MLKSPGDILPPALAEWSSEERIVRRRGRRRGKGGRCDICGCVSVSVCVCGGGGGGGGGEGVSE